MANLIKGIDNNCKAVRAAMRRAEERGVVWRSPPLIRGIDNNSEAVQAAMWRAERNSHTPSSVQTPQPQPPREPIVIGPDRACVPEL